MKKLILNKNIIKKKKNTLKGNSNNENQIKDMYSFNPAWISGFTQADGNFYIGFDKKNHGMGVYPRAKFTLSQHIKDLDMFENLIAYLGVGYITKNRSECNLVVSSIDDIINIILPIFENYPLRGSKLEAFEIFKYVVLSIKKKKHLTLIGLIEILELSYFMNQKTSNRTEDTYQDLIGYLIKKHRKLPEYDHNKLKNKLDNIIKEKKINIKKKYPLNLDMVTGLIDGDGSFNFSFKTTRRRIVANFTVVQDKYNREILEELIEFFNCGQIYDLKTISRYQVENLDYILNNIIKKLNNTKLNTFKREHYKTWIKGCNLIYEKGYKTDDNLLKLVELAYHMNNSGKNRKLTKNEYISKMITNPSSLSS